MGDFTYEHLFDFLRRERSREEIQELDDGFYDQANSFLEQQAAALKEADPLSNSADHIRTQLQNSKKLLRELYDRREKKILMLALNKARTGSSIIDTSNIIPAEQPLLEELLATLKKYRESITPVAQAPKHVPKPRPTRKPVEQPKQEPSKPAPATGEVTIKVTAAVPKFMGSNSKTYGPYDAGKEVSLPERIANILIKKGRAEQV